MGFITDHPHTSITDTIDRVVSSRDYTLEIDLGTLVGLIRDRNEYQYTTNQEEAARALRKKLKYGNKVQQSRSLDLIDLFVSQGLKFTVMYNDDKLIERIGGIAIGNVSDSRGNKYSSKIVQRCANYVIGWYNYINSNGLESSRCYASFSMLGEKVKRHYSNTKRQRARSNFMDDGADETIYATSHSNADQLYRIPQIDMKKAAPSIRIVISDGLAAGIALKNALMVLPQGQKSVDDEEATAKFIQARALRRKVLRYLQLVTEGEFLGSLIHANDELVSALSLYDEKSGISEESASSEYDYSEDENQDSDEDDSEGVMTDDDRSFASVQPSTSSNPFGDHNRI